MTLSTNVYILDPVDVPELFRFCQGLLTQFNDRPEPQQSVDKEAWRVNGARCMRNEIGQGMPAILDITYRPGGPLTTAGQAAQCTEDCDSGEVDSEEERYHHHEYACFAHIDFDTAYGYRDSAGRGCGDLHAALVAMVGKWCDEREVRWEWRNEYSGEVHGGETRYERLFDLMKQGSQAAAWFRNSVLPAIANQVTAEQRGAGSGSYPSGAE